MYLPSSRSDIDTYIGLLAVIVNENRMYRHSACLSSYQIVELTLPYDIQSVLLLPSVLKTIKRSVVIQGGGLDIFLKNDIYRKITSWETLSRRRQLCYR